MVTTERTEPALPRQAPAAVVRPQSRARYPDVTGFAERDGVRTYYEVYGTGEPSIVFVPAWSIVHSRIWKAQIPDFARRHRVATFDPRGNGGSDRPATGGAYAEREHAQDLLAVMDAAGIERAVLVSLSLGAQRSLIAVNEAPARVSGLVFIGPAVPIGDPPDDDDTDFDDPDAPDAGWGRYNRHSWRRDYEGFLTFFFGKCFTEPHSTKQTEDAIGWGREIGPEALILSKTGASLDDAETRSLAAGVRCPTLVIQGDEDAITGLGRGVALAEAIPGARLVTLRGSGHVPNARDPVKVNLLIREFVAGLGYER